MGMVLKISLSVGGGWLRRSVLHRHCILLHRCLFRPFFSAMLALNDWGVEFRVRRPSPGMTSAQHEKTWLVDSHLLVVGSANATRNSFDKCEETVIVTQSRQLIGIHAHHFQRIWDLGEPVDWPNVREAEEAALARSRSRSRRSPSPEVVENLAISNG